MLTLLQRLELRVVVAILTNSLATYHNHQHLHFPSMKSLHYQREQLNQLATNHTL